MLKDIDAFIANNNMLRPKAKVIVGLSGGADSIALIHVLSQLGYHCIAAHCNFSLRGKESDKDEIFVKRWCTTNEISLRLIRFETKEYAEINKISIEMAARELRYSWFEKLRSELDADTIAVAHHLDDSAETILLNLVRGTGINGLVGIRPKNGYVIRPFLCVWRKDIEDYILENSLSFITDSTNLQDIYVRNSLRLTVLPLLEKLNPSVKEAFIRTANNLSEVKKIYDLAVRHDISKVLKEDKIDIGALTATVSPSAILYNILSPLGFTPSVIDDICAGLKSEPGKLYYSNSHRLIKDRDLLLLDKIEIKSDELHLIQNRDSEIFDPIHLAIKTVDYNHTADLKKDSCYLYADSDKLKFPLKIRRWHHGDWFIPFGMTGRKKLSDHFRDRKLSIKAKENVWIITTSDDEIVWIVGERSDNRFRVDSSTRKVLIIKMDKT